jgi:hypothetical protein
LSKKKFLVLLNYIKDTALFKKVFLQTVAFEHVRRDRRKRDDDLEVDHDKESYVLKTMLTMVRMTMKTNNNNGTAGFMM